MTTTLNRIAKRDARVADVEDLGRDEESRYWIHLRSGWYSPEDGSHTITGRTVREAMESLALVTPCRCRECESISSGPHRENEMRQIPDRRLARPGRQPSDFDGDIDEAEYKAKRRRGRPPTSRGAYNPIPARQLGRVADEDWATLKAAAAIRGETFTAWAMRILLAEAEREQEQ